MAKVSFTAHLDSGNGDQYITATLSAPVNGSITGIKFYAEAMNQNKLVGTVSVYGLKKITDHENWTSPPLPAKSPGWTVHLLEDTQAEAAIDCRLN